MPPGRAQRWGARRLCLRAGAEKGPVAERGRELRLVAKHGGEGPDRLQKARSQEAVRIDINADARTAGPGKPTQPFADYVLYVQRPPRVDQQPVSMASAQYGQRGRSGTIDAHALHLWSGLADQPGGFLRILGLLGGNHDGGETAKGRPLGAAAAFRFCTVEALAVILQQRLDSSE